MGNAIRYKIPEHQDSMNHNIDVMLRGEISKRLLDAAPQFHYRSIQNEAAVWKQLLHVHAQIFASYFVSCRKGVCVQR